MAKQKVSVSKLQKFLNNKSSEELKNLIMDIASFDEVQSYFYMRVHPENIRRALDKYKKIIKEEFYPENKYKKLLNYDVIKKCVKDFQASCPVKSEVARLMLYVVEIGSEFSSDYSGIDEEFYEVIEGICENAFIYIRDNNLIEVFKAECEELIENGSEEWGFKDQLEDMYEDIIVKKNNIFTGVEL